METDVLEQSTPQQFCTECGRPHLQEDLVRFGDAVVCADCKPTFVQRMREGAAESIGAVVYGGFWRRFVALIVDSAVMFYMMLPATVVVVLVFFFAVAARATSPQSATPALLALLPLFLFFVLFLVVPIFYIVYFTKHGGSTPGKMLLGLKVVTASGGPIDTGRAVGRFFARWLSDSIFYIGDIMAGFDSQKRALHDRICETRVVGIDPTLFGRRIGAFALDSFFCGLFGIVVTLTWYQWRHIPFLVTTINQASPGGAIIERYMQSWQPSVISVIFAMIYSVYFTSQKGATPGKMLAGLKVVTALGNPIGVGRAFARYLSTAFLSQLVTFGIGFTIAAFDKQNRALQDHLCATRVVRERELSPAYENVS